MARVLISRRWLPAAGILAAVLIVVAVIWFRPAPTGPAGTVLITGANRGIGLALAREYAARDWQVIATARRPEAADELNALAAADADVSVAQLDVTSDAEITALAEALAGRPIDVLLNNAGSNAGGRGQKFGELDWQVFDQLMQVNAVGPMKMAQAFLPNVLASRQKKIVVISSIQASIDRSYGGSYAYRASKAALNMLMRTLARDLEGQGVVVGILAPGVVATDMNRGLDFPMIEPEESARGLVRVIDSLTPARSGHFVQYDGSGLPW